MISLKNISKKFDNQILFDIDDLQLKPGIYSVSGENGSGKSTLMNIITGNCEHRGVVDLGQIDINQISYVNQDVKLFKRLTIKQNLQLLLTEQQLDEVSSLAEDISFTTVLKTNKRVTKLSGGERQKLQLIVGLLRSSEILILDEFDNNLDLESISKVLKRIISLNKQYIFIISHNPELTNGYVNYNLTISNEQANIIPIDKGEIVNNNKLEIDQKKDNRSKLNNANSSLFNRYNHFNYAIIVVGMLISLFIVYNIVTKVSINMLQFSTVETTPFADDVSIVTAPRYTLQYQHLGDESWLNTTEYGFTQAEYDKLVNLEYVEEANFMPSPYGFNNFTAIKYNEEYIDFSVEQQMETVDLQSIDYEQLNSQLDGIDIIPQISAFLGFAQLQAPSHIYNTTPLSQFAYSSNQLIYGDTPKDESNEIAIDIYIAELLAEEKGVSVQELIGQEVSLNLEQNDLESYQILGSDDYTFIISGIYNSSKPGYIIYSYHQDSLNTEEGVCNNPSNQEIVLDCKYTLSSNPLSQDISYMDDLPDTPLTDFGLGMSIYVKTTSDNEKNLAEAVESIDPYIEVDNNYTRTHNEASQEFFKLVIKNIGYLLSTILAMIIVLIIMFKLIKRTMIKEVLPILDHYKFEEDSLKTLLNTQKLKLLSIIAICEILFMVWFMVHVKFTFSIFMFVVAFIFAFILLILALVLKVVK